MSEKYDKNATDGVILQKWWNEIGYDRLMRNVQMEMAHLFREVLDEGKQRWGEGHGYRYYNTMRAEIKEAMSDYPEGMANLQTLRFWVAEGFKAKYEGLIKTWRENHVKE